MKKLTSTLSAFVKNSTLVGAIAMSTLAVSPLGMAAENSLPPVAQSAQATTRISINSATVQELMQLNGVGEKKAQAIVDYRNQHGKFEAIEQLMEVKGIGESTFNKNKDLLVL